VEVRVIVRAKSGFATAVEVRFIVRAKSGFATAVEVRQMVSYYDFVGMERVVVLVVAWIIFDLFLSIVAIDLLLFATLRCSWQITDIDSPKLPLLHACG